MKALFNESDGVKRMTGYTTTEYQSDISGQAIAETTEDDLASIFEDAKAAGETLGDPDESIEAAIDDPLAFRHFLILDSDDSIAFDSDYVRETPDETQA